MPTLKIAALVSLTLAVAAPAQAERLGDAPRGPQQVTGGTTAAPVQQQGTSQPGIRQQRVDRRWGGAVNGRWQGGSSAPGGWKAYRRPVRGYTLPRYWTAPSFYINDFASYGLAPPPYGYSWNRYYDDAVLVDTRGQVYDSVGGIDWDGQDAEFDRGGADRGYDGPGASYARRDDGVGGAVAGAVVGGIAGSAIAGRGNRVGGALIGAGVGAVAGYAIDKNEDRGRRDDRGRHHDHDRGYDDGRYGSSYYYEGGHPGYAPPPIIQQNGTTTTYTTSGGYVGYAGGYASGGYWYPAPTVTTITVQSAPVVETTTTEYVTYTKRRVYRAKKKWHPAPKRRVCSCR